MIKSDSNMHLRISSEMKEKFTELCKAKKKTPSEILKRYIRECIKNNEVIAYERTDSGV
jgi:predicted DNA-binding protein